MGQPRRKEPQRWEKPRGGGSPLSTVNQSERWRWMDCRGGAGGAPGALGAVEPASERSPGGPLRGARTLWKLSRGDPWTLNGGPHSGHHERKQPSMDPCSSFCLRHLDAGLLVLDGGRPPRKKGHGSQVKWWQPSVGPIHGRTTQASKGICSVPSPMLPVVCTWHQTS